MRKRKCAGKLLRASTEHIKVCTSALTLGVRCFLSGIDNCLNETFLLERSLLDVLDTETTMKCLES